MLQCEGTIVVLYDIPADDEAPFVNLFLPHGYIWEENEGWICADLGNFYAAVFPIGPYAWHEIREDEGSIYMVHGGNLIDGWLLRLNSSHPGLVLEAVEADECQSFAAFCQQRAALQPELSQWPDGRRITVATTTGHALDLTYDGAHLVDGTVVDYDAYPLYESPNARAALGTGKMVFTRGDEKLALDFGIDAEQASIPMRVIG